MVFRVVSKEKGQKALNALHHLEQEMIDLQHRIAHTRKHLPWVKVDSLFLFESHKGTETLADLFGECSQLLVFHFYFKQSDKQGGLLSSVEADNIADILSHLYYHNIRLVLVSDAPLAAIDDYQQRMGWHFKWCSNESRLFNDTFLQTVEGQEAMGISVFVKDNEGVVYHTYHCSGQMMEVINSSYQLMDLTPMGRGDANNAYGLKRHDSYQQLNPLQQHNYKIF